MSEIDTEDRKQQTAVEASPPLSELPFKALLARIRKLEKDVADKAALIEQLTADPNDFKQMEPLKRYRVTAKIRSVSDGKINVQGFRHLSATDLIWAEAQEMVDDEE